jgi:hypothetical protein
MRFLVTIIGVIWHRASHKDPRRARLCSSSVPLQPY